MPRVRAFCAGAERRHRRMSLVSSRLTALVHPIRRVRLPGFALRSSAEAVSTRLAEPPPLPPAPATR